MTNECKEYLADEIMLTDEEIKGLELYEDDDYVEEWFAKEDKEYYLYKNVKELGADHKDNECRDRNESDEEFGEFLLDVPGAGYIELVSGRVLWLSE